VIYRLLVLATSILGLAHSQYWYAFSVIELLVSTPARTVLVNVLRAVTENGPALLLVLFLGVIVVYIFAIFAYINYSTLLLDDSNNQVSDLDLYCWVDALLVQICTDILTCFVTIVGQFPSDGDYLRGALWGNAGGMVYQLVFYFVVIVILLNTFFGIIVYVHVSGLSPFIPTVSCRLRSREAAKV